MRAQGGADGATDPAVADQHHMVEGGQVVQQARAVNSALPIIARAHFEEEIVHLKRHGANIVVMGEHEIAKSMLLNIAEAARKRAKPRRLSPARPKVAA